MWHLELPEIKAEVVVVALLTFPNHWQRCKTTVCERQHYCCNALLQHITLLRGGLEWDGPRIVLISSMQGKPGGSLLRGVHHNRTAILGEVAMLH